MQIALRAIIMSQPARPKTARVVLPRAALDRDGGVRAPRVSACLHHVGMESRIRGKYVMTGIPPTGTAVHPCASLKLIGNAKELPPCAISGMPVRIRTEAIILLLVAGQKEQVAMRPVCVPHARIWILATGRASCRKGIALPPQAFR